MNNNDQRSGSMLNFYKLGNNGELVIETDCKDENDFVNTMAERLAWLVENNAFVGDWEFHCNEIIRAIIEIGCKYRGYKVTNIYERKVLICGTPDPNPNRLITYEWIKDRNEKFEIDEEIEVIK